MLNDNVISGQTELASGLATTDELLVSDAGTLKRMDMSGIHIYDIRGVFKRRRISDCPWLVKEKKYGK